MAPIYAFTILNAMMCVGIAVAYVLLARLANRIHADLEAFSDKIDELED